MVNLFHELREAFPGIDEKRSQELSRRIDMIDLLAQLRGSTLRLRVLEIVSELDMYFKKSDIRGKAKEVTQWSLSVQRRIVKRLLAVRSVAIRNED